MPGGSVGGSTAAGDVAGAPGAAAWLRRTLIIAWGVFLVGAMTWPFLLIFAGGAGAQNSEHAATSFALRDMMVLPHPAVTHASLGFGDLPARSSPQDGVLGVVGKLMPATWFVAAFIAAAAGTAAWVGARVGNGFWTRAAAMTVAVWNPFVVERLLQGQWSLAAAAWLLPAVALCRGPAQLLAMWAASLTPTGGLFALITGLSVNRRWSVALAGLAGCAPWIVPGVLAAVDRLLVGAASGTASAESAAAFAPRAEAFAGTLGSLLGLGGIWNAGAVPASREAGFALVGVALFALLLAGARAVPRPLLALASVGFAVPLVSWLLPGAMAWVVSTVPGAGLLRDAHKFLALAIPAYVVAAGSLPAVRLPRASQVLPAAALACAVLQVPDAPRALAPLAPVQVTIPAVDDHGRDVFFIGRPPLATRPDGLPVVDPATKAMNVVESGELVVDGVVVDKASPRWRAANEIFADAPPSDFDPAVARYYSDPEVGLVVKPDGSVEETGLPARPLPGLGLLGLWLAVPLLVLAGAVIRRREV